VGSGDPDDTGQRVCHRGRHPQVGCGLAWGLAPALRPELAVGEALTVWLLPGDRSAPGVGIAAAVRRGADVDGAAAGDSVGVGDGAGSLGGGPVGAAVGAGLVVVGGATPGAGGLAGAVLVGCRVGGCAGGATVEVGTGPIGSTVTAGGVLVEAVGGGVVATLTASAPGAAPWSAKSPPAAAR
jgi:hypothetical protein